MCHGNEEIMKKKIVAIMLSLCVSVTAMACGKSGSVSDNSASGNEVAVEDAITPQSVMQIGDYTIDTSDLYLYLIMYTSMNGIRNDQTPEGIKSLMTIVLNQVMMEKLQYQLSLEENCTITDEEKEKAAQSAENFVGFFGEGFLKHYGVTKEKVEEMFTQSAYSGALEAMTKQNFYNDFYADIEAEYAAKKLHSVTYALFPTIVYDESGRQVKDENGATVYLGEEEKAAELARATELMQRAKAGEEMEALIEEYGIKDFSGQEHEFDGAYVDELNDIIASLSNGDISDVYESVAGYMVVRMDNTDDTDYKAYLVGYAAKQQAEQAYYNIKDVWAQSSGISMDSADMAVIDAMEVTDLLKRMYNSGLAVYGDD